MSDNSSKESIIFKDSILFYQDRGIKYYDLKTRTKKTIQSSGVLSLAVDSFNNMYWLDRYKDSVMFYNFNTGDKI